MTLFLRHRVNFVEDDMHFRWMGAWMLCAAMGCSDSSKTTTTAVPNDGGGSALQACDAGAHFVVDPKDGKCKLDGTTTNVGAACTSANASVCGTDQNASCLDVVLDQFPGGYCNVDPCTSQSLCPIGSSCVHLNGENGQCFKDCTSDSDCRMAEGYMCLDMTADAPPPAGTGCSTTSAACWESGGSHKICARPHLNCVSGPSDCPSAFPHCVSPDGGAAAFGSTGAGADDAALTAPPPPATCVK